ncbi:hypothetical protein [Rhizobium binae]|uniref:Uncharacterized protein n=1 Tax=Rhizobium binae TaxID=1138190 RepID=A0ABV2MPA9_9HYPH|nr:hypothetical protein [Rhizobium binae]NKL52312.1 hypothetical protein [Rhizobium leguminosarum bv. viciae]MBX4927688.1 hypothetical protein [Rhizobium binae]MBX4938927.1 hypothetical protein [Rhizobium binae]MBX4945451.1 hypothetical protein [Rhizobium binae]MBX4949672.1 hypothetical protein [Rhizobium binae]
MQHSNPEANPRAPVSRYGDKSGIADGRVPDFRLQKSDDGDWQVLVISVRGSYWLRANHIELCDDGKRMNLSGANAFLREARRDGFKTEYVGPNGAAII